MNNLNSLNREMDAEMELLVPVSAAELAEHLRQLLAEALYESPGTRQAAQCLRRHDVQLRFTDPPTWLTKGGTA